MGWRDYQKSDFHDVAFAFKPCFAFIWQRETTELNIKMQQSRWFGPKKNLWHDCTQRLWSLDQHEPADLGFIITTLHQFPFDGFKKILERTRASTRVVELVETGFGFVMHSDAEMSCYLLSLGLVSPKVVLNTTLDRPLHNKINMLTCCIQAVSNLKGKWNHTSCTH